MGEDGAAKTRQQGLQQAASVIFALVAVVPLLIFAWTLHALGVIRSTQAQVSLGLALAVALLGFWMFRSLLGRMAEVVQALTAALEQASRLRRAPAPLAAPVAAASAPSVFAASGPVTAPAAPPARPEATTAPSVVFRPPAPAAAVTAAPSRSAEPVNGARPARAVAGLGAIRELSDVARTMDALWHREATAHIGQRVQISVANSREPLVGTLSEATAEGLILEQPEGAVPIGYARVTAIDRLSS
jgi:hypothetical protein